MHARKWLTMMTHVTRLLLVLAISVLQKLKNAKKLFAGKGAFGCVTF